MKVNIIEQQTLINNDNFLWTISKSGYILTLYRILLIIKTIATHLTINEWGYSFHVFQYHYQLI